MARRWNWREPAGRVAAHVGVIVKIFQRRLRAFLRELHARQRRLFRVLVHFVELLVSQLSFARELRAQPRDRVVHPILLELLLRPVTRRIRHGMTAVAIGPDLDKGGMRIFPDRGDDFVELVAHLAKIHPVGDEPGNVVAFRAIDDLLQRSRALDRCAHGEEVILADENDRKLVEPGEVERLVERALVDRAVAEEAKRDAIFPTIF